MKRRNLLIIGLLFGSTCALHAQYNNEEYEITVTTEEGKSEIIELPEGLTSEMDSLLDLYHTKTYLEQDPSCQQSDYNPEFDRDTYIERLRKLPTVMEMSHNNVVQKFIDRYTGRMRRHVSLMLGLSNFYMPIFEQALESYGLPLELKYLPIIESALNPKAVSRVGATGLWQFMLATGKRYGLQVNSLVDERKDPIRSSYAAAQYLRDLFKIFGDWNLVIAAYNCGPENINRAIRRAGGEKDYWKIYPYLPAETRGYVPAFIAANYIMNYYCEHNICPMLTDISLKTDTIQVNRDVHLQQIAAVCNTDLNMLRELNPQYRRDIVNGGTEPSVIRLPLAVINKFIDNEDSIYNYNSTSLLAKRTEVEVTETASAYSNRSSYSRPSNSYSSHYGRGSKKSYSSSKRGHNNYGGKGKGRRGRNQSNRNVTVKKGETLSQIAARNGTTVKNLQKLNGIKGSNIQAGKKIRVK